MLINYLDDLTFSTNDKNAYVNKYIPRNLPTNNNPYQNKFTQNQNTNNSQKNPYTLVYNNNNHNTNTLEPKANIFSNKKYKNSLEDSLNSKKEEYEEYLNSLSIRSSKDKFFNVKKNNKNSSKQIPYQKSFDKKNTNDEINYQNNNNNYKDFHKKNS